MLPVVEADAIVLADDESVVAVDVSVAPLTVVDVEPAVPATLPVAEVEVSSFFSVETMSVLVDLLLSVAATAPLALALPLNEPEADVDDGVSSVEAVLLFCVSLLATFEESVLAVSVELVADEDGVDAVSLEASEPDALLAVEALPLNDPEAELGELVSLDVLELLVAGSLLATREESVLVEDVSLDVAELGLVLLLAESVLATLESVEVRPVGERLSLEEAEVAPELIEPELDNEELDVESFATEESELVAPELVLAVVSDAVELFADAVESVLALGERSRSEVELIAPLALPEPAAEPLALSEPLESVEEDAAALFVVLLLLLVIDVLCELELAGCDDVVSMLPDAAVVPFKPNEPEALVFAAEVSALAVELLMVFELLTVAFCDW